MTRLIAALLLAATLPAALQAQPMSAAEFEAYVTGRTLTYLSDGQPYGTEQYLTNRRVLWAFSGDECVAGQWYEAGDGLICFAYEGNPTPQCWTFQRGPRGLIATYENEPDLKPLYETSRSNEPLNCPGPWLGV